MASSDGGQPASGESLRAPLMYQGPDVPRGLLASGKVGTRRDGQGSDGEYFGCEFVKQEVSVTNGRGCGCSLDSHGFALAEDPIEHIDYLEEGQIVKIYYPLCCELVRRVTGAERVVAFDHNLRSKKKSDTKEPIKGGQSVAQPPALIVHNDYSLTSAPRRVRDLALPPKVNDTMRQVLGDQPLLDPAEVDGLLAGRWAIINVWRNISEVPVQQFPLAMCEGPTVPLEDVIVFEIHYADRIGENYFAAHSEGHRWFYFPSISRDEAILLKCWDSAGAAFATEESSCGQPKVPATFSFHTAFEDPSSPADAADRQSLEVRTLAFFPASGSGEAPISPTL